MRPNLINLLLACGILVLITACFCRSEREREISADAANNGRVSGSDSTVSAAEPNVAADTGDFVVDHQEVTSPRYAEIDRQVKAQKTLEKAADRLNQALKLPADVTLRTKDCRDVNAFYNSADRSVTVCYEMMEDFFRTFRRAGYTEEKAYEKMFDAVRFVFLHEIGHALIDVYKLPVAGNEEDAADRCSAFINLTELGDEGVRSVFAAADAFNIESKNGSAADARDLSDEHLLQEQRYYSSLCMIYGSDTEKYADIVRRGYLPKERADRCSGEYQRTVESWVSLLAPWRK